MKLKEALGKAVIGFKVRHDGMQAGSYIHYPDFNGFRIQFVFENGHLGSSSQWAGPDKSDKEANWYVIGEDKVEPWPDFVQTNWNVEAAINVVDEPIYAEEVEAWPSLKQ